MDDIRLVMVDKMEHVVSQTKTNPIEYCPKVPWGITEIVHFVFIIIVCFLVDLFLRFNLHMKSMLINVILIYAIDIGLYVACFLHLKIFVLVKYNKGWAFLMGSNLRYPHRKKLALLLGLFFGVLLIVRNIISYDISKPQPLNIILHIAIFGVIVAPCIEELWFRSFIYRGLRRTHGVVISVCVSSLLFAAYHPFSVSWPIMIIGPLLALYYEKTGSLVGCVLAHSVANLVHLCFLVFLPMVM